MLEINEQFLDIENAIDDVVAAFIALPTTQDYCEKRAAFLVDEVLQVQMADFQELRSSYEQQKDYLSFRPEVKKQRKLLYQMKRALDVNENVIAFRQSEVAVQAILAELTSHLSQAVSPQIFVDTGLPLAPHKPRHDSGRGNNIKEKESYV